MPLSEEELRLLEQMERALSEEDPKFASTLCGTAMRRAQHRQAILAGVFLAGGIALLMTGVITQLWLVGLLGFLVMLISSSTGLSALRGRPTVVATWPYHPGRSSFLERAEQRWRRRHGGDAW